MRFLFFFLGIVCFVVFLIGAASPIRSQEVDAGAGLLGLVNFFETKLVNLEKASPTLCHIAILVGLIVPFLFLFKAHELVSLASFVLGATLAFAFVNNLLVVGNSRLGHGQPFGLPWLAMFGACAGYHLLASSAKRSDYHGALSLPFKIDCRLSAIVRVILAIGLGFYAIAIAGECLNSVGLMSRASNLGSDIMSRHYQEQAVSAFCVGSILSVGAFFAWPKPHEPEHFEI